MRKIIKLLSVMAAFVLLVCAMPTITAKAAPCIEAFFNPNGDHDDDGIRNSLDDDCSACLPPETSVSIEIPITKYFVLDANTRVPDVEFTFTLTPGTPVPATATTPEIKAGFAEAELYMDTITFTSSSTTYTSVQSGDSLVLPTGTKYAKQNLLVCFWSDDLTAPGVYRWVITESGSNTDVVNDSATTRYLDVYVVTDADGNLSVPNNGWVFHKTTDVPSLNGAKPGDAPSDSDPDSNDDGVLDDPTGGNDSFVNTYLYEDKKLTLTNTIAGNQADFDKEFVYVITVTNPTELFVETGTGEYHPTWTGAGTATGTISGDDDANSIYTTYKIVVDSLAKGESGVVNGIPSTAQVSVATYLTDDNVLESTNWIGHDGYVATYSLDSGASTEWDGEATPISWDTNSSDHTLAMTLTKNVSIPTGINVNLLPWILMLLIVVAAYVAKEVSKKNKAENK